MQALQQRMPDPSLSHSKCPLDGGKDVNKSQNSSTTIFLCEAAEEILKGLRVWRQVVGVGAGRCGQPCCYKLHGSLTC